ncbi:pyruvate:ferredoxin (flavodoxin) oxidoreductase [Alkalispirochaeta sphaeroplastigenens]|uniref:Pyruvate:ferredoxin (Flavodoxin) oxidoreductase n=1 Tax=Alkalispirochaeta sphaeroplastigenens TaxID=1187066 RepID=A0A2S4K138_9SPIO|nr:pyruvate:ferredoxin (flavodoxin) oxidoreductase [Alkalispirochaeta sphaeroplastigenens]POR05484.1 pyruvate:ferredoxin (flavodoxin) oxidoreductase [Alkalispirochaeta sphaeroplastigenens]
MPKKFITLDGNEATARIAYAFSEVAAIYPITPSSNMGEFADAWAAEGRKNLFGETLEIIEMQSEAGAAGAVHGSLTAGAMTTTFTASQGLLLMIPNMYKIAGELLPTVFHVSARSIAAQSLSIFGDHSDVMGVRQTGFGLLSSANVQEAQDMAAIAHLASLESRIPFVHFFDGFRTSHSMQKIEELDYDTLRDMLDMTHVEQFRAKALRPEKPMVKVGAQNPDVYFQGRETVNNLYDATPEIIRKYMKLFAEKTGRTYDLFQYVGADNPEKVVIAMGSGVETIEETVNHLVKQGEKVGLLKVRLYRPWSAEDLAKAIPASAKKIVVLDRTKEPGAPGEPLYLDVVHSLRGRDVEIIGGRYGLSSKEFTPAMVKAVYDHADGAATHDFTVGINDDVSNKSLPVGDVIDTEQEGIVRCKFWGYGSDGTVSANKNSIKIIGAETDLFVQAYFSYDSNKSGGFTVSHLRFGKEKIQSEYLLTTSDFIALHRPQYIGRFDILEGISQGGTFLINTTAAPEDVFSTFTASMQQTILDRKVKVYAVDASKLAKEAGLGNRINTVMQVAFFKLAKVIDPDKAIELVKKYVEKQFISKGQEIVEKNWKAIDMAVDAVKEVPIPAQAEKSVAETVLVPESGSEFGRKILEPIWKMKGDDIPVSAMPLDGQIPTGTKRLEMGGRPGPVTTKWAAKSERVQALDAQFEEAYFEYPGSCMGCGEIPYVSLITQLYGDRMMIANATGCSSIYGGTFPAVPYTTDSRGRGPVWANSLFEDNAEYGFGMRLAVDAHRNQLKHNVEALLEKGTTGELTASLKKNLDLWTSVSREAKDAADQTRELLPAALKKATTETRPILAKIIELGDYFVDRSIWIFGGDGWAYDIGYGGLDHVMAQQKNVNVLVMDTEVYSNTGGQASKSTPRGAIAKFAADGKKTGKKNLGLMMTTYGHVYVASVNMGMNRDQVLETILEAEAYDGPSIILAYSPCIAHGYDMKNSVKQSKNAAESGYWPIYRFNPANELAGKAPFQWETPETTVDFSVYTGAEIRYRGLELSQPEEAARLHELAKKDNKRRFEDLKKLSDA